MKLPIKIKSKITSMVNHSKKSIELQKEVELFIMQELHLTDDSELDNIGITDQIIDTMTYTFNADGLIEFIEKEL